MFWKTVAPFYSCKSKVSNKIVLTEGNKLINNDLKSANFFFNCIIKELNIPIDPSLLEDVSVIEDPTLAGVQKFKRRPSILKIKEIMRKNHLFYFHQEDCDQMLKSLQNLDCKKATQQGDIPVRIIKKNKFIFSRFLSHMFSFYIDNNAFPNGLKKTDINPVEKSRPFWKN